MPLTMPVPSTYTYESRPGVPPCAAMYEVNSSKVNPPTDQKFAIAVEVLRFQIVEEKVTGVPNGIANTLGEANTPESRVTSGLIHDVISVAVAGDDVSYVRPPVKPMLPVIGTAWGICVEASSTSAAPAK